MAKAKKIAVEEERAVAAPQAAGLPAVDNGWGGEGLSNSDIMVPKLLLMQGLSDLVADGTAIAGQIRDSLEGKLFGGVMKAKEAPTAMEVIPFSSFKTWVVFEKRNGKDEYVKTVPFTAENEGWAIEEVVGGVQVRRDKCLNFYVLRPEEIKEGAAFPYLVSFRRTSMPAGRKLATMAAKLRVFNQPIAMKVINLTASATENDKGKYFVYDLSSGRNSTAEEIVEAKKWHTTLKTANVKIDDSDLKAEASVSPRSASGEGIDF
jgi:hypothetical protein